MREAWRVLAACIDQPTRWWFSDLARDQTRARSYCAACLVRTECRDSAIANDEYGIWGGLTKDERHRDPAAANVPARTCRTCGALFFTKTHGQRVRLYCSAACRWRAATARKHADA
jgi:hypothetical protein